MTNNSDATIIGKVMPVSAIVLKKRPGGVAHPLTRLFPTTTIIANPHIVPANDRKHPIIVLFTNDTPLLAI
jgi:hypothetical protein